MYISLKVPWEMQWGLNEKQTNNNDKKLFFPFIKRETLFQFFTYISQPVQSEERRTILFLLILTLNKTTASISLAFIREDKELEMHISLGVGWCGGGSQRKQVLEVLSVFWLPGYPRSYPLPFLLAIFYMLSSFKRCPSYGLQLQEQRRNTEDEQDRNS